ncbi:hypothetical protein C6P46_006784 [Rhodotorula mucilaginosa]|uniref:RecA family profile 1 domain-containing protein n=1 Tax=Rhodotorula mucilaginosa TaxID=5537 RepID=A0A9P6W6L9_RHOMI|nr:hypothetical protein C6P46_006784 [Rhodotorula mucilaginosa]TKA53234.1 hypothetical protein B0A53_04090 [Rhodotorula sp. CCFEE 5036]
MTALSTILPRVAPQEELQPALDAFTQLDIVTDVDLHFAAHVPPRRALPPDRVDRFREQVASNLCAVSSTGNELLRQRNRDGQRGRQQRFSTSLEPLDDYLDGGFDPSGDIVQVTGPRRSGRTAFALYTILLHLLLHPDARGAWFDSSGSFDPHRCLAILRDVLVPRLLKLGGTFAPEGVTEEPAPEELAIAVLDRLAVSRVNKSGQVLDVLANEVGKADEDSNRLDMVVIDSLDNLLGGEALQQGSAEAHASLIVFMRRLTTLARSPSASLAVLVITTLPSPSTPCRSTDSRSHLPPLSSLPYNPPLRPALDDTFAHQVDLSLLLTSAVPLFGPEDGKDRGFVEVVKNVRGQEGGLVVFELSDGVILTALT